MRKLSCLITGVATVTLSVGLLGCPTIDPGDPFDSLTTVANDDTTGDGDGDMTGDGDGDMTGDGDGDMTGDGDPTGDGDGDACGGLGATCSGETCCEGLSCQPDGTCGIGGGDGDGDPGGDSPWDPMNCAAPSQPIMVGDLPGTFCSAPCMGAMDPTCPAGPAGTQAQCALTTMEGAEPSFCALVCAVANDACPAGSTCKDLMDANNPGVGLCTYP